METTLIAYVKRGGRKKGFKKVGMLVAHLDTVTDKVGVGFSLCNTKLDAFCRDRAFEIAAGRAFKLSEGGKEPVVPHSIRKEYDAFTRRAISYFKEKDVINSPYTSTERR